jgi:two-component system cell cycle response regulator DivK
MNQSRSVLYVEDNLGNRILVRRILQSQGYQVLEAADAQEALDVVDDILPDLILMDINMPEVDGFTLTRQIKQVPGFEDIPIIALTANVMKGDRERTLEAGCDGYIEKPIDVDNFITQINLILKNRNQT